MNLRKTPGRHRLALLAALGLAVPAVGPSQQEKAAPRPSAASAAAAPVVEIVIVSAPRPPLEPGELVDLGLTWDTGAFRAPLPQPAPRGAGPVLRPGEGPGGKALLNPNREYRPGWDSTLIPGYSMPFSNSPEDYREGRTIAYPPGEAVQAAPGAPPMMTTVGGDAPKVLTNPGGWNPPPLGPSTNPPVIPGGSEAPLVPDVHEVPRVSYDPNLPAPGVSPTPAPPKR
jgi:hypothetical protein